MSRVMDVLGQWVKGAFTANLGLKALSLATALGLVAFTRAQLEETQRTVPVPVVLRLPAESSHRELMTPMPANVHVTLLGSTRAIDRLIQTGVTPVELDLRDGDKSVINFEPGMFSIPTGLTIKIIDPPSLALEWQDVIVRSIPIQASRTGQPAKGYELRGQLEVEPKQIQARGPASLVEVMQFARLAAFDVTGLTEGVYRRQIAIDDPPSRVRYLGPKSATVTAEIGRRLTEAKYAKRPVSVVGAPRARTTPRAVDVTVTGPPDVVAGLRDEQVNPHVSLESAGIHIKDEPHGSTTLKVRVDLANAEVEVQPPTVTVTW